VGGSWVFSASEGARNYGHNTLYICQDITVPEPEHPIAMRLQKFGSSFVGDHLSALGMTTAVNLDDEPACVTAKIHKVPPMVACRRKWQPANRASRRYHHSFRSAGVITRRNWRASGTRRSFLTVRVLPRGIPPPLTPPRYSLMRMGGGDILTPSLSSRLSCVGTPLHAGGASKLKVAVTKQSAPHPCPLPTTRFARGREGKGSHPISLPTS
jgi:hypothetical protein